MRRTGVEWAVVNMSWDRSVLFLYRYFCVRQSHITWTRIISVSHCLFPTTNKWFIYSKLWRRRTRRGTRIILTLTRWTLAYMSCILFTIRTVDGPGGRENLLKQLRLTLMTILLLQSAFPSIINLPRWSWTWSVVLKWNNSWDCWNFCIRYLWLTFANSIFVIFRDLL